MKSGIALTNLFWRRKGGVKFPLQVFVEKKNFTKKKTTGFTILACKKRIKTKKIVEKEKEIKQSSESE